MFNDRPLISSQELKQLIDEDKEVVILDATIPKAGAKSIPSDENPIFIPGALRFDIKRDFSDLTSDLPNTFPTQSQWEKGIRDLGINDQLIVVYDQYGIYSSARAWWMLRTVGFMNVKVLNGGLPGIKN